MSAIELMETFLESTPNFSAADRVGMGIMGLAGIVALTQLPGIWRKDDPIDKKTPGWWVWGDTLWQAFTRCLPVGGLCGGIVFPLIAATSLIPAEYWNGSDSPWWMFLFSCVVAAGLLTVAALLTLVFTIALFNRPKFAVAPRHRNEPGAVTEWLKQYRRWRKKRSKDEKNNLRPPADEQQSRQ